MPKTNEPIKPFDINEFTKFVISTNFGQNKTYDSIGAFDALVFRPYNFNGPKNDQEYQIMMNQYKHSPETQRLIDTMYQLYTNPDSSMAQEFHKYWKFISPLFNNQQYEWEIMNIINKIDIFDDETQLIILRFIKDTIQNGYYKETPVSVAKWTKIANNPKATAFDKADAAVKLRNENIIRDAIEALKQELHNELNQRFPDVGKINKICGHATDVMRAYYSIKNTHGSLNGQSEEGKYYAEVLEMFKVEKALSDGAQYIPKLTQSLEERVAHAEAEASSSQDTIKNKESEIERLKRDLAAEQQKSGRLTQELNNVQNRLNSFESFVKTLRIKIGALKVGLFGKGNVSPEQLQEWVKSNAPQDSR